MATTLVLIAMLAQHGQLLVAPPFQEDAAVRLAYMKDSVSPYRNHRKDAGSPLSLMISWARDGASSGSCPGSGSATARPVRGSRMAPCSPSRSGPTQRWSL